MRGRWSNHPIGQTSSLPPWCVHVARKHKIPKHKLFATLSSPKTSTATPPHSSSCPPLLPPPCELHKLSSKQVRPQFAECAWRARFLRLFNLLAQPSSLFPLPTPTLHAFAVSFYASNSNSLGLWLTLSCSAVYTVASPPTLILPRVAS